MVPGSEVLTLRRGSWMSHLMVEIRSEPKAEKMAAKMPKTDRVSSIGIMTLKESLTAGGTSSPRLILSLSMPESLMKSSVASRPMMMPENIELVPRLPKDSTPLTSAVSPEPSAREAARLKGIIAIRAATLVTPAASGLLKTFCSARR